MKNLKLLPDNNKVLPLRHRSKFKSTDYSEIIDNWVGRLRSQHTQRLYRSDIADFVKLMLGAEETSNALTEGAPLAIADFFSLDSHTAHDIVNQYHKKLVSRNLSPATINRRLAALASLVKYGNDIGKCSFDLSKIDREKVETYRDTTGINKESFKKILATCDLDTIGGVRDYAILMLLWGNALRRSELAQTNVEDFDPSNKTLRIVGKGRSGQYQTITLGKLTVEAISNWLKVRGEIELTDPLFSNVHRGYGGSRLTVNYIYKMVRKRSKSAAVKVISPHKIRHSSITAALDATDGDVRKVQKLSRHKNINTLLIYDDNRKNLQGEITGLLEGLL